MSSDDTKNERPAPTATIEDQDGYLDTLISDKKDQAPIDTVDSAPVTTEHTGRYEYEEHEIGRGGLGRVLGAFDVHLGREVAVKELLLEHGSSGSSGRTPAETGESLARFLREARVTAQLEHPNIVSVYELGRRKDGTLYYTMKYVRGRTLKSAIAEAHDLSDRLKLLGHFVDLCHAIAYAHSRGVIHRDIKPDNVMIGEFGETVVLDWGVAKVRGAEDLRGRELARSIKLLQEESAHTIPGAPFGTPAYMSPEQAEGRIEDVDERSDVWSLGVVLYQILSGKLPFAGKNVASLLFQVLRGEYQPINEVCPEAPRELAAVAEHAIRFDPRNRYQSARELAEEIEAYRSGAKVEVYDYSSIELMKRFVARNRPTLAVSLAAMIALLTVVGAAWVRLLGERDRAIAAEDTSRKNLADAFVEKGRLAEREKDWVGVSLLAAGALGQAEHPEARGLVAAIDGRWRPELAWHERTYAGCAALAHAPKSDEIACATNGGVLRWRGSTGEALPRLDQKGGWVHSIAYAPDGAQLAVGGEGEIAIWNGDRTAIVQHHQGHEGAIAALAWSRDGRVLASSGEDGTVRSWGTGSIAWRGTGAVKRLAYSPQGDLLVFADSDGNLHRLGADSLRTIESARAHGSEIGAIAFASGGAFVTSGGDRIIRLWSPDNADPMAAIGPLPSRITALAFDGEVLHAAASDGHIRRFGGTDLEGRSVAHERTIRAIALSPDGAMLFTAGEDRIVRAFRVKKAKPPLSLELGHDVRAIGFAMDTDALAVAAGDQLRVFDAKSAEELSKGTIPGDGEGPLAFTSDWVRLAIPNGDAIRLIDSEEGVQVTLRGHEGRVTAVAFAKDALISGGSDETVRIWPNGAKQASKTLKAPIEEVTAVATTPDRSLIAAADGRGRIVFWKEAQANLHHRLELTGRIRALAFSPDGKRFAVAADRRVSVYDTRTWRLLMALETPVKMEVLAFSKPGRRLAMAAGESVRILRLRTLTRERSTLLEELGARYGARLSGMMVVPRL